MAEVDILERQYYIAQLGLTEQEGMALTLNDLRYLFFSDPPEGGGGGGDPVVGGDLSGVASNAQIVAGAVGGTEINAAIKDPVAGTAGLRTLGTGAQQAAQGNLVELLANKNAASGYAGLDSNSRVPAARLGSGTPGATTYLAGDQSYKDPVVGGDLTGTISNAQIAAGAVGSAETSSAIEKTANKNAASGYAGLDASGFIDLARVPAGYLHVARKVGGNWPGGTASTAVRPTARTDVVIAWLGADPSPPIVGSGTGGMLDNVDVRWITQ